jgi:hypothetical protein
MQRSSLLLVIGLVALATVVSALASTSQKKGCDHSKWLAESLMEIETIKVGMTRRDLMKLFGSQGGLSMRTQETFVYHKSSYIQVTVKFEAVGHPGVVAPEEADIGDDRIVEISGPFIAWQVLD